MNRAIRPLLLILLLLNGCGGARLSHEEIRKQVADLGSSTLLPQAVHIQRVVSESGNRSIVETTVELTFQFERDSAGSPWHIASVRLGDQNWIPVTELVTAVNELRRKETTESLQKLTAGIDSYRQRNGTLPSATTIQSLADVLHPNYMSELILEDSWGRQIEVDMVTPAYRFRSLGPDGRQGTLDDILVPPAQ